MLQNIYITLHNPRVRGSREAITILYRDASGSGIMLFIEPDISGKKGQTIMFANSKFTQKNAPYFFDSCEFSGDERIAYSALKPYIFVDSDNPPKALITFDFLTIPVEDRAAGNYGNDTPDIDGFVALTPEDAIGLMRYIGKLLMAVYDEQNYAALGVRKKNFPEVEITPKKVTKAKKK